MNRSLPPLTDPAPSEEGALSPRIRGSGAQSVYASLRRDILDLTLSPGSPLDESGLSERFAMSRTPIREALMKLAADGLATTLPNRSTIVAPIDFATLPAYFEALTLMYRVTTRAAARRGSGRLETVRGHQADFAAAVEARDVLAMIEANRDFHVAIAELGANPYFTALFTRLLDEGRRILRLYYASFDDRLPRRYVDEHEAMIAAIEAGDTDGADRLASGHAAQIVRQIQDYIAGDAADPLDLSGGVG
jgi:DNA-binding GntR family transcriptional regulator